MNFQKSAFLAIFFLSCFIGLSLCCDGYKIKLNSIKNCGGAKQVVKVSENTTLKLTKECDVIPSNACVKSEGFKTAQATYRISKNGIPVMNGKADLCGEMAKSGDDVKGMLEMFGLPTACPIEKTDLCSSSGQKVNIKKNKQFLSMAMGKISIHTDVVHDTGKSCFEAEITVKK
ncbi:uncharacterized protein LOC134832928 [Culicoides brevitarsis]|uniref:uncharacterized protein LOC134832928 n=1 Tax=Culicoides brevitarsis TaxID=469753 RepID=UPI00307B7A8D